MDIAEIYDALLERAAKIGTDPVASATIVITATREEDRAKACYFSVTNRRGIDITLWAPDFASGFAEVDAKIAAALEDRETTVIPMMTKCIFEVGSDPAALERFGYSKEDIERFHPSALVDAKRKAHILLGHGILGE